MARLILISLILINATVSGQGWVRINQLGYLPESVKIAVFISTESETLNSFSVSDAITGKTVFKGKPDIYSGAGWGMKSAARLNFSSFEEPGGYFITINEYKSPVFRISADVYSGSADFILR